MELVSKLVLCGDSNVGKSSLRENFMGFRFSSSYRGTIGSDMAIKKLDLNYNNISHEIIFYIWDLAGQQNFAQVRPIFYNGADAAFIVYDITNKQSFDNVHNWMKEIKSYTNTFPIPVTLIGNKLDLQDCADVRVQTHEVQELSAAISTKYYNGEVDIPIIETSALTGQNVNSVFSAIGIHLIKISINLK